MRHHRLSTLLVAACTAAALVTAGCSSGAAPTADHGTATTSAGDLPAATSQGASSGTGSAPAPQTADSNTGAGSTTGSTSTTDSTGPAASSATDAPHGDDALKLTGPAQAATVPDMTPVITDPHPKLPATVKDSTGKSITVTKADRVLALDLYGTLTDTIIGLGLQDRLVGRAVSDTQKALKDLPVVSLGGINLNAEAVLSLKPDVILTNRTIGSDAVYQQLAAAGVTIVQFDQVPSIKDISAEIHEVGAVFGMAKQADELAAHTQQQLDAARATITDLAAATPRKPRAVVLYVRGSAGIFFILGKDYGAADVLRELHLDDVAAANGITNLTPANAESLVSLDPEIVLTMKQGVASAGGLDAFLKRPGMSATTAGRHQRIVTAADSQLLSYGPRTPQNLLALADAIYTDADADVAG